MNFHYLDGLWVTTKNLKISVFDLSVVRGFGCFDFLRTYGNKPFLLNAHLDRFFRSAKILGLKIPLTRDKIKKIIYTGIGKNNFIETNIKVILTGGVSSDAITPGKSSFIVIFTKAADCPRSHYEEGVRLITIPASRVLTEAKSLDYLMAVVAMQGAKDNGADEALYLDKSGKIYEATRSNFFAVIGGKLNTVKDGVLLGVTRKVVLDLAKKLNIEVIERDIFLHELKNFREAFITASNKEIMPVIKIDEKMVGNGKVGQVTKRLMEEFRNLTHSA